MCHRKHDERKRSRIVLQQLFYIDKPYPIEDMVRRFLQRHFCAYLLSLYRDTFMCFQKSVEVLCRVYEFYILLALFVPRELGFDGKTLIHPKTVDAANAIFAPSEAEIAWAQKIIAAHAEAEKAGQGVVVVDGRLVESLHVLAAKRQVALADAIAALAAAAKG